MRTLEQLRNSFTRQFGFEVFQAFNSAVSRRFNPMSIMLLGAGQVVSLHLFQGHGSAFE